MPPNFAISDVASPAQLAASRARMRRESAEKRAQERNEKLLSQSRDKAKRLAERSYPTSEGWDASGELEHAAKPAEKSWQLTAGESVRDERILAICGMPQPLAREVALQVGTLQPVAEAVELSAQERAAHEAAAEEARRAEEALQQAREAIGKWSKSSVARLAEMQPATKEDERDAKRLSRHVWAVCRMAGTGSLADLSYAVQQMAASVPLEVLGCWVVVAMGMREDGSALRQLYSPKARRLLVRSYALWSGGRNDRLRHIAGSPSRRTVRGVKRLPQRLLARVAAVGGRLWHRSTTTRDATELHNAGLWRRVRMHKDHAHAAEKCGPSGQVVSRYWMELPRLRKGKRSDPPTTLAAVAAGGGIDEANAHNWVRGHATHAIRYAVRAVQLIRRAGDYVTVPQLMHPLLEPSPT